MVMIRTNIHTQVEFAATVVSDTLLHCIPPAVIVNGLGTLEVGVRTHSSIQPVLWSGGTPVEYTLLFDVALGRRPYITEASGHVLMRCNTSLLGSAVTVEATLPDLPTAASRGWRWENIKLSTYCPKLYYSIKRTLLHAPL